MDDIVELIDLLTCLGRGGGKCTSNNTIYKVSLRDVPGGVSQGPKETPNICQTEEEANNAPVTAHTPKVRDNIPQNLMSLQWKKASIIVANRAVQRATQRNTCLVNIAKSANITKKQMGHEKKRHAKERLPRLELDRRPVLGEGRKKASHYTRYMHM